MLSKLLFIILLILISVDILGVRLMVWVGYPCRGLPTRSNARNLHLVHKYTHIGTFRKYTFKYPKLLTFVDVSFFRKKLAFSSKKNSTQSNS